MSVYDLNKNVSAFLDMLAYSEGTIRFGNQNGYNVIVGGALFDDKGTPEFFDDYADHPRKLVSLPKLKIKSTAAGRYQLLSRYYDYYKKKLGLKNFEPLAQDLIAIQQIKEQKAFQCILDGDIKTAIDRCKNIWASLPGAGYGQHEHKLENLLKEYDRALQAFPAKKPPLEASVRPRF